LDDRDDTPRVRRGSGPAVVYPPELGMSPARPTWP